MAFILSIDAGTSSVRVSAVDEFGSIVYQSHSEIGTQSTVPGYAEQDPEEVCQVVSKCITDVLQQLGSKKVTAIGVTNQRESFVLVDPRSDEILSPIVLWLDRRSASSCDKLKEIGLEEEVRRSTGLAIDPYFTATKAKLVLSKLRSDGYSGPALLATVDSLIINRLSGGGWVTDPSNASRTLLYNIDELKFSDQLKNIFGLDEIQLPEVRPSFGTVATVDGTLHPALRGVPITGVLGDQQASLLGQGCTNSGSAKNTYGTGAFVLMNTGARRPVPGPGVLASVAWGLGDGSAHYVLEGSIFACGSILKWMRDDLRLFASYDEVAEIASSTRDTGGVYLVPAFEGLGSPWLDSRTKAAITGLSNSTTKAHLVRAAVEAMAYQTQDVVISMGEYAADPIAELRVDGGATVMDLLCQFQADQLGIPVTRGKSSECTTLGAAYAAGIGIGLWNDLDEVNRLYRADVTFEPTKSKAGPRSRHVRWLRSLSRARGASQRLGDTSSM